MDFEGDFVVIANHEIYTALAGPVGDPDAYNPSEVVIARFVAGHLVHEECWIATAAGVLVTSGTACCPLELALGVAQLEDEVLAHSTSIGLSVVRNREGFDAGMEVAMDVVDTDFHLSARADIYLGPIEHAASVAARRIPTACCLGMPVTAMLFGALGTARDVWAADLVLLLQRHFLVALEMALEIALPEGAVLSECASGFATVQQAVLPDTVPKDMLQDILFAYSYAFATSQQAVLEETEPEVAVVVRAAFVDVGVVSETEGAQANSFREKMERIMQQMHSGALAPCTPLQRQHDPKIPMRK